MFRENKTLAKISEFTIKFGMGVDDTDWTGLCKQAIFHDDQQSP